MGELALRVQRTGLAMLAAFAVLALAAGYWHVVRADDLNHDSTVSGDRTSARAAQAVAGRLVDRRGNVLAQTVRGQDGALRREYADPGAVHIVGYTTAGVGAAGAEAVAADRLSGRDTNDPGTALRQFLHLPMPVVNVPLSIDPDVQRATERAMGTSVGAAVALDPRSGQVLAMVSNPTFDPHFTPEQFQALNARKDAPLLNRATGGLYSPGSTFKTVTLAAAFEANIVNPSSPADCPVSINIKGQPVTSRNEPPGKKTRTVADAYAYSCNTYFAQLGVQVGADRFRAMAAALGVSDAIPFDLPTAQGQLSSTPGFLADDRGLAFSAFGQGEILVTPLQLALIAATVANGGLVPEPRLFGDERPATWRRAFSEKTASMLSQVMTYGVEQGWANTVAIPNVKVAGKTGSAEIESPTATHAVFIAFAPADNPRVAVAVLKEHAGAGSTQAGPVVKAIIEAALAAQARAP